MKRLFLSAILFITSFSFSQNQLITIGTIGYDIIDIDLIFTYDSIDTELLIDTKEVTEINSIIIVNQTFTINLTENKFSIIETQNFYDIYFTRVYTENNKDFMEVMIYTSADDFCPYVINFTDTQLTTTCNGIDQKFKTVFLNR